MARSNWLLWPTPQAYSAWSTCSDDCGTAGVLKRIRSVSEWAKNGGTPCDTGSLEQANDCNRFSCNLCAELPSLSLTATAGLPDFADATDCDLSFGTACLIDTCTAGYVKNLL